MPQTDLFHLVNRYLMVNVLRIQACAAVRWTVRLVLRLKAYRLIFALLDAALKIRSFSEEVARVELACRAWR